jgi:glycosyltransferase involved in cell wall biosynthesis
MPRYLGIPKEKIRVVPLGINAENFERRERDASKPFTVGYFARIAPEKGLKVLAAAYRRLRQDSVITNTRLEVAGYLAPEHRGYLAEIQREMNDAGLGDEFHYRGEVDREQKIATLRTFDVLSVPATYDEPKGIFLLEAMACAVPVVQPRRGGFTEIVEKTGGGVLVTPDDAESLAAGIAALYHDAELRKRLGENGFQNVREHYTVSRMADRALEVYEELRTARSAVTTEPQPVEATAVTA